MMFLLLLSVSDVEEVERECLQDAEYDKVGQTDARADITVEVELVSRIGLKRSFRVWIVTKKFAQRVLERPEEGADVQQSV